MNKQLLNQAIYIYKAIGSIEAMPHYKNYWLNQWSIKTIKSFMDTMV